MHRECQQQNRTADGRAEGPENRTERAESVVEHAAYRSEEGTDQCARQHQRTGDESVRTKRKLSQIGDDITESDADDRQDHVGDQMQQHHRIA